jgi:hypothetical protein
MINVRLTPKSDIHCIATNVRYWPEATEVRCSKSTAVRSPGRRVREFVGKPIRTISEGLGWILGPEASSYLTLALPFRDLCAE